MRQMERPDAIPEAESPRSLTTEWYSVVQHPFYLKNFVIWQTRVAPCMRPPLAIEMPGRANAGNCRSVASGGQESLVQAARNTSAREDKGDYDFRLRVVLPRPATLLPATRGAGPLLLGPDFWPETRRSRMFLPVRALRTAASITSMANAP